MHIIGLTGSIGMGKSSVASAFRYCGAAVYDADYTVHSLMAQGGVAVEKVAEAFPDVITNRSVDRQALGEIVYNSKQALETLERILHPLARDMQIRFLRINAKQRNRLVVLDIPLLFEKQLNSFCDSIVVVTAPYFIQSQRVLARPGMTKKRFYNILDNQMPDSEKKKHADFIIQTGLNKKYALSNIRKIMSKCAGKQNSLWSYHRIKLHA